MDPTAPTTSSPGTNNPGPMSTPGMNADVISSLGTKGTAIPFHPDHPLGPLGRLARLIQEALGGSSRRNPQDGRSPDRRTAAGSDEEDAGGQR
jgi:hypothetical protein